ERRSPRTSDAERFFYDDVHVIASLGEIGPVRPREVLEREFEIQIRTGVQYAWWRATHDVLYKGLDEPSWRLRRVASQLKANLELVDGALADLPAAATLLEAREDDRADPDFETARSWLDRWPQRRRPTDVHKFADAVGTFATAAHLDLDEVFELFDTP